MAAEQHVIVGGVSRRITTKKVIVAGTDREIREEYAVVGGIGRMIYQNILNLPNLAAAPYGGPGATYGQQTFYAGAWNLSGRTSLTFTLNSDARVGYWASQGGDVYSYSSTHYLQFWDGSIINLGGPGYKNLNIAGYSDAQKSYIQLRVLFEWNISTIDYAAFYGGWSLTGATAR